MFPSPGSNRFIRQCLVDGGFSLQIAKICNDGMACVDGEQLPLDEWCKVFHDRHSFNRRDRLLLFRQPTRSTVQRERPMNLDPASVQCGLPLN